MKTKKNLRWILKKTLLCFPAVLSLQFWSFPLKSEMKYLCSPVRNSNSRIRMCFLIRHGSILMEEMLTMGMKDFVSTSIIFARVSALWRLQYPEQGRLLAKVCGKWNEWSRTARGNTDWILTFTYYDSEEIHTNMKELVAILESKVAFYQKDQTCSKKPVIMRFL